ncbi:VOC family protein [Brevibacillus dissolubilis]|uniref:VOC family protein n=1 Tax=Brevibacillus dissolubilis TaxID=1844116 RepID=UPI001116FF5D|nr:VOC family protein [Brevibacillus dissolubilis]
MFQLDRLVYATKTPEEVDRHLQEERKMVKVASGKSFPGVATNVYPFPGGGFLEVAYIEDESKLTQNEGGLALKQFLDEKEEGYYAMILETDNINHVKNALTEEEYPVQLTGVQEMTDLASGEQVQFQMLGTYPHLPWFVQYSKKRTTPAGFPQAAILRTTTFTADMQLLEKLLGTPATTVNYPNMICAILPLRNASFRIESSEEYGFGYFEPRGVLMDKTDYSKIYAQSDSEEK